MADNDAKMARYFRDRADEMRKIAVNTPDYKARETLERMARELDNMAQNLDELAQQSASVAAPPSGAQ